MNTRNESLRRLIPRHGIGPGVGPIQTLSAVPGVTSTDRVRNRAQCRTRSRYGQTSESLCRSKRAPSAQSAVR